MFLQDLGQLFKKVCGCKLHMSILQPAKVVILPLLLEKGFSCFMMQIMFGKVISFVWQNIQTHFGGSFIAILAVLTDL